RASAHAIYPSPLAHIALHHRPPAPEFPNALPRPILFGELRLLVISTTVTALMHGFSEQPLRTHRAIEWNHRGPPGCHIQEIEQRLGKVVRLHRTSRNTNNWNSCIRFPFPTQIIGNPHTPGGITPHRMNSA